MIFIENMEKPAGCSECPFEEDGIVIPYCCVGGDDPDIGAKKPKNCPVKDFDDLMICSYKAKDLIAFAIACQKHGVDEKDMKAFANNCEWALKVISDEQRKVFEETFKRFEGGILSVEESL